MGDIPYRDGLCPRAEGLPLMSQHSHVARAPRDNSELIFEFTDSFVCKVNPKAATIFFWPRHSAFGILVP